MPLAFNLTKGILNYVTGNGSLSFSGTNVYMGLSSTAPILTVTGSGTYTVSNITEPTTGGYARLKIGSGNTLGNMNYFDTASSNEIKNGKQISFNVSTGAWKVSVEAADPLRLQYIILSTNQNPSSTDGGLLAWGQLTNGSQDPLPGDENIIVINGANQIAVIPVNGATITIDAGEYTSQS